MKTILIAVAAALAFSAVPAAQAQDNMPQVNVSAGSVYLAPDQFRDYANLYRLSNGQVVQFTQSGNHFFTQVDHGKRVRIIPVSTKEFITAQGTRIVFRESGDEVGISNFEKLPMAQALPANTIVMARR
ncbi:hypothetical protein ASF61_01945 [Duganella sp. Leaf126]|uniref:hypothetical protein n=1 Tax=Duganella sp. Leaf126 TaxID=1736266 RepID=UPI0006FE5620|nr:hypothetical protein [Duganella sp. Leaf126]KQQ47434.1 hypothetical protein ASF61_01945 [Duganella sp. Leaf126]